MSDHAAHIVEVPRYFFFIRIAQAVLALVVFILACYSLSFDGLFFGGDGYAVFVCVATFIILGYYFLSTLKFHAAYNRWAVLVLECFANIWWLACWANLAAWAAAFSFVGDDFVDGVDDSGAHHFHDALAAGAGIGALVWILFTVTLIIFGMSLHRHRMSGAPDRAGAGWTAGSGPMAGKVHSNVEAGPMYGQQQEYSNVAMH